MFPDIMTTDVVSNVIILIILGKRKTQQYAYQYMSCHMEMMQAYISLSHDNGWPSLRMESQVRHPSGVRLYALATFLAQGNSWKNPKISCQLVNEALKLVTIVSNILSLL